MLREQRRWISVMVGDCVDLYVADIPQGGVVVLGGLRKCTEGSLEPWVYHREAFPSARLVAGPFITAMGFAPLRRNVEEMYKVVERKKKNGNDI